MVLRDRSLKNNVSVWNRQLQFCWIPGFIIRVLLMSLLKFFIIFKLNFVFITFMVKEQIIKAGNTFLYYFLSFAILAKKKYSVKFFFYFFCLFSYVSGLYFWGTINTYHLPLNSLLFSFCSLTKLLLGRRSNELDLETNRTFWHVQIRKKKISWNISSVALCGLF